MGPIRVLFLCTQNSCRSQMAEGFLRRVGGDTFEVFSAGRYPAPVHPLAVETMAKVGIDITTQRSKSVEEFRDSTFEFIITVCDNVRDWCPVFPGTHRLIHWSFEDPCAATGTPSEIKKIFARVRDDIENRVRLFAYTQNRKKARRSPEIDRTSRALA